MSRVSIEDLEFAAAWLRAYDALGPAEDLGVRACLRVARKLEGEIQRRIEARAMLRAQQRGVSPKQARRVVREEENVPRDLRKRGAQAGEPD